MKDLGISIYPEESTDKELFDYIDRAKDSELLAHNAQTKLISRESD